MFWFYIHHNLQQVLRATNYQGFLTLYGSFHRGQSWGTDQDDCMLKDILPAASRSYTHGLETWGWEEGMEVDLGKGIRGEPLSFGPDNKRVWFGAWRLWSTKVHVTNPAAGDILIPKHFFQGWIKIFFFLTQLSHGIVANWSAWFWLQECGAKRKPDAKLDTCSAYEIMAPQGYRHAVL